MATRSVAPPPRAHRVMAQPTPVRRARKRFPRLRRLLKSFVVVGLLLVVGWLYILQVYAPGLRVEARSVPALVSDQLSQEGGSYVSQDAVSPDLRHAIVAIEDRRFYEHPGIDPLGMVRAFWVNLTSQHVDQGGSTLEQQLVKRAIVKDDRSIHAKLRTVALAWAVDQEFSKSRILELYLNAAYYGQGAYGVGSAARIYFGTDPLHLTLAQAAFLAAMPQAPSIYGAHPTAPIVIDRERSVLGAMQNLGYITSAEERAAEVDSQHLTFSFPNP